MSSLPTDVHTVQYFIKTHHLPSSAPSGPPRDLTAMDSDSNSIDLRWKEINCIDRNTEITGYIVRYGPVSNRNDRSEVTAAGGESGVFTLTLTGLSSFTSYSIQVAGNSDLGPGPFSDAITAMTNADGELTVIANSQ